MAIWAVWLGDGVAFSTDRDSRKAKNFTRNPNVSIAPERGTQSVIVEGVVEPLSAERVGEFFAAYEQVWETDISGMDSASMLVRPRRVFGFVDEADGFPLNATRWTFE